METGPQGPEGGIGPIGRKVPSLRKFWTLPGPAIRKVYDAQVGQGAPWRKVFEACDRVVKEFKRAAMTSSVSYR